MAQLSSNRLHRVKQPNTVNHTKTRNPFRLTILVILLLLLTALTLPILAHELRPSIVEIELGQTASGGSYTGKAMAQVNLESLIAGIGSDHDNTDDSPNSDRYQSLRALTTEQLAAEFELFRNTFIDGITLLSDSGRRVPVSIAKLETSPQPDLELARNSVVTMTFEFLATESGFSWQSDKAFGEMIVRTTSRSEELDYAALLAAGQRSEMIQLGQVTTTSFLTTIKNYTLSGFEHILPKGLDHILFIVGLFLLSPHLRPLLLQTAAFTVAHSITLVLSTLGIISFPAAVVEPLIALSIVVVCIENILTSNLRRWRILWVFLFGLLHGLGFASVLAEVGLSPATFLPALLGFNLGVELGQITVVAVCLLLIGYWHRDKPWYKPRFSTPASVIIGAIGLFWFAQRTGLI